MRHLLVGIDLSPASEAAMQWASDLAAGADLTVTAARVYVATQAEVPPDEDARLHAEQLVELREWCAARSSGAEPATVLLDGDPANSLQAAAHDRGVDLLVVGGRGTGGFAGLHLGSVAHHLVHQTDLPLAVVPPEGTGRIRHLVVGVDGSEASLGAVEFAARLVQTTQVGVTAVHAHEPFFEWVPGNDPGGWRRRAAEELAEWTSPIAAVGVDVEQVVDRDLHPVAALVRAVEANPGATVVIGARGLGGFLGLRLGRVPLQLVHHAHAPVVIVPGSGRS